MKSVFVFLFALLVAVRGREYINNIDASGNFSGLFWDFNAAKATLTISGEGGLPQVHPYGPVFSTPWDDLALPVRFIVFNEGVTGVGGWVFRNNKRLITVSFPSTFTYIGKSAFEGCWRLRSAPLPPNLESIGENAFDGCKNLENITLPPGLTELGSYAFRDCSKIDSIDIPPSLTVIDYSAFEGCTNLTHLTIPDGVATIKEDAFKGCSGLTEVYIPASVGLIQGGAFRQCTGLSAFDVSGSNYNYMSDDEGVIFYRHDMNLVQYPAGRIGNYTVKSNVKSIETGAFSGSSGLTYVKVEANIKKIPMYAFEGCTSLKAIDFVYTPETFDAFAFLGCSSLEVAPIAPGVVTISTQAFANCSFKSVTIPPSVTTIDNSAFLGCKGLETVVFNSGTNSVPGSCFEDCTNLKSVSFSDRITSVGSKSFMGCSSLTDLSLPKYIKYIHSDSFSGCDSITSVVIPSTVLDIYDGAFARCNKLESITVLGTNTSYVTVDGVLFKGNTLLQYPCGKGDNYVIPSNVEILMDKAFAGCRAMTTLNIPSNVKTINSFCFAESGLKSFTFPSTVEYASFSLFQGCVDLESVVFDSASPLDYVGSSFFDGCRSLKYVSLPPGITSFSTYCFKDCVSLSNLTIPATVTFVSDDVFINCVSLTFFKYEGKTDPCNSSWGYYYTDRFPTCVSLDIACVPLDYEGSVFCEMPICKTSHCQQEVSKFNQCYEVVKCGEPDAEVRLRANASEWIHQTDDCVEYVCDNNTGRVSWSKCGNGVCVQGKCMKEYAASQADEYEVEFIMDGMPVDDWNMTETSETFSVVTQAETQNTTKVAMGVSGKSVVKVLMLTTDFEAAETMADVGKQCSRDPDSPAVYDDMCDEFNCTGFMHNIKKVRVSRLQFNDQMFLEIDDAHLNRANQLVLFIVISLIAIAVYLM